MPSCAIERENNSLCWKTHMLLVSGNRDEAQAKLDEVNEKRRQELEQKERRHVWRRKEEPSLYIAPAFQSPENHAAQLGQLDWAQVVGSSEKPARR